MTDCRLYLITPPALPDLPGFAEQLARALDAGDVAALQLRLKDVPDEAILRAAEALMPIAHRHDVAFLMNDRMDLAKRAGCDGVHLGQGDGDPVAARKLLGAEAMIGVTCHASRHLAMEAGEAGADYVAFGAFFPTGTKATQHVAEVDLLEWWSEMFEIPSVAIGGIGAANCPPLVRAGADFLAVVGAVWNHPEGAAAGVRAMNAAIKGAGTAPG
jgi:thiamine-phosphate pyrophosphorylase